MSKKLPLFVKITFAVLLVFLSQINTSFAQGNPGSTISGEMTFIVRPMPLNIGGGKSMTNLPVSPTTLDGIYSLIGVSGRKTCITSRGKEIESVKYLYALYLDEEKLESTLTTNQKAKTASLKLRGQMRMWESNFIENNPDCAVNSDEIEGGEGGLELSMSNKIHLTPLNFIVGTATGRVFGPGFSDSLTLPSSGSIYAKSEIMTSTDTGYLKKMIPNMDNSQAILDAMKKAGIKPPEGFEETIKQNKTNVPDHTLYGVLNGSSKEVRLMFQITSGFTADMLVYKPEAMASSGGGSGSAKVKSTDFTSSLLNGSFMRNASYNSGSNNFFFEDKTENLSSANKKQDSGSGILIPKRNRDKVQAFVNLDNDNKDESFDINDKEKIADKDDDMVKVILRIKEKPRHQRKGVATFKLTKGEQFVKIWEKNMDPGSTDFSKLKEYSPRELIESNFKDFITPPPDEPGLKGFIIKEFWVEGIDPQTSQKGTAFEFKYYENGNATGQPSAEEKFELTVIGIEKIEWKGEGNSYKHDDNLDDDPNHHKPSEALPKTAAGTCGGVIPSLLDEGAVRVFPGKRMNGKTLSDYAKNRVTAKVTLSVEPVEPIKIYFDSFDVDDPSASTNSDGLDNETSAEDNRGSIEGSKSGKFRDETNGILEKVFTSKTEVIQFYVTMQPGDNFRIVGFGDKKFFQNLENDDSKLNTGGNEDQKATNKQKIVDKYIFEKEKDLTKAEILFKSNYASKVLTVWRFVYGEVDYMGPRVGENKITGTIKSVKPNDPKKGQTTITVYDGLAEKYAGITNISTWKGSNGVLNAFQEGRIEILGESFKVQYSSNNSYFSDTIIVNEAITWNVPSGTVYTLYEDDEAMGFTNRTDLQNIPGRLPIQSNSNFAYCQIALRYQFAYVVPDFLTLNTDDLNPNKTVKFVRNISSTNDKYDFSLFKFDNTEHHQKKDFWTVYILFAYKGATYEDGDPDGQIWSSGASTPIANTNGEKPISGVADTENGTGIYVFVEGCIERNAGSQADMTGSAKGEKDTVIHELGHIFGAEHTDSGLMDSPDPTSRFFSNKSILAIRKTENP